MFSYSTLKDLWEISFTGNDWSGGWSGGGGGDSGGDGGNGQWAGVSELESQKGFEKLVLGSGLGQDISEDPESGDT